MSDDQYYKDMPAVKEGAVVFNPRGMGSNWLPCFICGPTPLEQETGDYELRTDVAAFVPGKEAGEAVVAMFNELGLHTKLDFREHEPHWCQVKTAACAIHVPNLLLLTLLVRERQRVELAPVTGFDHMLRPMTQYGERLPSPALYRDVKSWISVNKLKLVLPDTPG